MPLREDLLNPIPGDNPSGANLRYDPVTEKIKEARREDLDVPQGDWKTTLKTADYGLVIKLGSEALAKRGKDLQVAVWLVDAHLRREGFGVLAPSFRFLRNLMDRFWDTLYPPVEDDDLELRASPLDYFGAKFGEPLKRVPITANKLGWVAYQESRIVGSEADADNDEKREKREARIAEGKISAEQFDEAMGATSGQFLVELQDDLNDGLEALAELSEFCDERFGGYSPSFIPTRTAIEDIAQTVEIYLKTKPEGQPKVEDEAGVALDAEAAQAPVEEPAAAAPAEESAEESLEAPEEVPAEAAEEPVFAGGIEPADREDAERRLIAICRFLRQQDISDPAPYLILRALRWSELLRKAPSIDPDLLEAPATQYRVDLKRQASFADWKDVLETCETAMAEPCGRAWLDLQRYCVSGLESLEYPATAKAVTSALRALLQDLPELVELVLADDSPAANKETRAWIENVVKPAAAQPEETAPTETAFGEEPAPSEEFSFEAISEEQPQPEPEVAPEPEPPPFVPEENPPILEAEEAEPAPDSLTDDFGLAMKAVRDGSLPEGLSIITKALASERSNRARFRRRTQLAHLLMAGGRRKVAQPLLDQLAAEIEERRLDDWEPGEALAYPLELLLHCLGHEDEQRKSELYVRLCRLDPVRAANASDI